MNDGLARPEFFVAQDIFFSEPASFADVVLPASPSLEKEGTFTSTERRVQRLYQVFEPWQGSRPDWQIIQDVANHLGAGWNYRHPSEIYCEIASLAPLFAGVTYTSGYRVINPLQWPSRRRAEPMSLCFTPGDLISPTERPRLFPALPTPNQPTNQIRNLICI